MDNDRAKHPEAAAEPVLLARPFDRSGGSIDAFGTGRSLLKPHRTAEKALIATIQGSSIRDVDDLVRAMGLSGTSKSQVSRFCKEIDERVTALLNRPLEGDSTESLQADRFPSSPYITHGRDRSSNNRPG